MVGTLTSTKNILEIIMVWGLIIGTLLSYVPQYYRLYIIKSVTGISESMLLFGIFSSYTNVLGSIQENLESLVECKGYDCYDFYIPIVQLFSPCLCALIFYAFYLFYYYYDTDYLVINKFYKKQPNNLVKKRAIYSLILTICILLYFVLVNIFENYDFINLSGKVLNIISTILSIIMWLPQIYTTYKLKNNHSLSLTALSIHAVGCLTTVIYQSVFLMQPVWVILCYIVGFVSETSIVCMCVYYKRKRIRDTNTHINPIIEQLLNT